MARIRRPTVFEQSDLRELPYMPVWVHEYLGITARLNLEQRGALFGLFLLCWMTPGCRLPREHSRIRAELGVSDVEYDRVVRPLLRAYFTSIDGHRTNKKLQHQYLRIQTEIQAKSDAGRLGGRATAQKKREKNSSGAVSLLPAEAQQRTGKQEPEPEQESISKEASQQLINEIRSVLGPGAFSDITDDDLRRVASLWLVMGAEPREIIEVVRERTAQSRRKPINSLAALTEEVRAAIARRPPAPKVSAAIAVDSLSTPETEAGRACLEEIVQSRGPVAARSWLATVIWTENSVIVGSPFEKQKIEENYGGILHRHGFSVELGSARSMH